MNKTANVFKYSEDQSHWNIQLDQFESEFEGAHGLADSVAELAKCAGVNASEVDVSFCEEWHFAGEAAHDLKCESRNQAFTGK